MILTAVPSWPESLVQAPGGDKPGGPWSASCSPQRGLHRCQDTGGSWGPAGEAMVQEDSWCTHR